MRLYEKTKFFRWFCSQYVSGCGLRDIKTVDWWRNHPEEAISKVEECKRSQATYRIIVKTPRLHLYKNQQQDAPVPQIN